MPPILSPSVVSSLSEGRTLVLLLLRLISASGEEQIVLALHDIVHAVDVHLHTLGVVHQYQITANIVAEAARPRVTDAYVDSIVLEVQLTIDGGSADLAIGAAGHVVDLQLSDARRINVEVAVFDISPAIDDGVGQQQAAAAHFDIAVYTATFNQNRLSVVDREAAVESTGYRSRVHSRREVQRKQLSAFHQFVGVCETIRISGIDLIVRLDIPQKHTVTEN